MQSQIKAAYSLAVLLDSQFGFGKFRIGLAPFLDLIPYAGDIIDTVLSLYIVLLAIRQHVPFSIWIKMVWNVAINLLFGIIPIAGSFVYFYRKANVKNAKLLKQYTSKELTYSS
jgi:hypothetical protein